MLDINFIRENLDKVKKAIFEKGVDIDIDQLLETDKKRRELIQQVDELRARRNIIAKEKNIEEGKRIKQELDGLEDELRVEEEKFKNLMLYVPNIPSEDSPIGRNSTYNVEILKWGEIPKFDFKIRDHLELGKQLDIIDVEAGVKVSGFRGYYLKNEGAILHLALLNFAFDKIVKEGFTPMLPPTLIHDKL